MQQERLSKFMQEETPELLYFVKPKKNLINYSAFQKLPTETQSLAVNIPQQQRTERLQGFKNGKFQCLVATNIPAEGLDFPQVNIIIYNNNNLDYIQLIFLMLKQKLILLQEQRKGLEDQIEQLNQQLQVYYDKGYHKSLIDDEGFPRQDLDFGELSTYKNLRREFNEKNNDYKDLMKLLEQTMVSYHEQLQNDPNLNNEIEAYTQKWKENQLQQQQQQQQQKQQLQQQQTQLSSQQQFNNEYFKQSENDLIKPFAYLEDVIKDSPADKAGFKINDFLIRFGIIDHSNHNRLQNLYEYIKNQQNKQINVKIVRLLTPVINTLNIDFSKESYIIIDLVITPQAWNGKGLLGWKMNMI